MEPPEEIRGKFPELRQSEGVNAELEAEGGCDCIGAGFGSLMGMAYESDGYQVVCGIFPSQSATIPGLLCDSVDSYSADIVSIEEMGLLDSMAFCECSQSDAVPEGRLGVYADSQLYVPCKRYMVAVHMVQII